MPGAFYGATETVAVETPPPVSTGPELPPKKAVMLALLEGSSVYVHLDPRGADVRVPPWFKKQPQLVLQVGLNLAVRIPDLDVGEEAVSCTLSFSRSPFFCFVPWSAVFALVGEDGKGMLWPNDVPPEVAAQQAQQARTDEVRARMHAVEAAPAPAVNPPAASDSKPTEADRRPKEAPKKRGPSRIPAGKIRSTAEATGPAKPKPKGSARAKEPVRLVPEAESKRQLPPYLRVVK